MPTKKKSVPKSPVKMSTKKHRDVWDKHIKAGKSVDAAHKATNKELGYTFNEADKREGDKYRASPSAVAGQRGTRVRNSDIPPTEVRSQDPKKKGSFYGAPRKKPPLKQ